MEEILEAQVGDFNLNLFCLILETSFIDAESLMVETGFCEFCGF